MPAPRPSRRAIVSIAALLVAGPIVAKLERGDDMTADWVWISLLALWQRWWPDRPGQELLDDKILAGRRSGLRLGLDRLGRLLLAGGRQASGLRPG